MQTKPFIPKSHVASGSYKVRRGKKQLIEAYLGTCVGVTLCDRHANVGGLIHLLLPEPTGMTPFQQPEIYATLGLPIFIQALCDAGAGKERLEACVAGGALVGPLSNQDLNLDIGGRTFEIVERIFKQEGIPILKAETGGFFTCCLSLNLRTWESNIEPLSIPAMDPAEDEFKRPTYKEIEIAMEHVRPIPQIALKIIRMTNDYRHSLLDISKEFRQDQILSAKVIRMCNSPFFRTRKKIDSIDRALVLLGEKRLLQL